jgi:hypothetical protein
MQTFNAALTPDDRMAARRAGRIVLLVYSATAIALTVAVLAHIAFSKLNPADAAPQARSKVQAVWHRVEAPARFVRTGTRL